MKVILTSGGHLAFVRDELGEPIVLGVDEIRELSVGAIVEDPDGGDHINRYSRAIEIRSHWSTLTVELESNDRQVLEFDHALRTARKS